MADFGLTPQGFVLKRLQDILADSRQRASEIFQDLVEPGDVVDTSDSSTIGRFINLFSVPSAELWELAQMVDASFDPNSATGKALDNIVAYGGIQRQDPTYSNTTALFTGETGTVIPINSIVGSNVHPNTFRVSAPVNLTPNLASGVGVTVSVVQDTTDYSITYASASGTSSNTITYSSDSDATEAEILAGLNSLIMSAHPLLQSTVEGEVLNIRMVEIFQPSVFSTSPNLTITTVTKTGQLVAEEVGPKEAQANTLNVIKTPVIGWDSVTNPVAVSEGSFVETDEQLRTRFRNTKFERSSNIMDSLYSALVSIPGVENVAVYENDTDIVDANGLSPHSFMAVVLGGEAITIAEAIWKNKPMGIRPNGDTYVDITDSQGFQQRVRFERPDPVTIYIEVEVEYNELYPADGDAQIRSAIIEYAKANFGVGQDIVYSRLYTPINSVPGHEVKSLYIGTSPNPTDEDTIPIPFDSIGSFESVNINVISNEEAP